MEDERDQARESGMDQQQQAMQNIEAVKLLSDFAKWLVTIETTAIAAVGYVLTFHDPHWRLPTSLLACSAVISFAVSILFATLLLRSLPGVVQTIQPGQDIWATQGKGPHGIESVDLTARQN